MKTYVCHKEVKAARIRAPVLYRSLVLEDGGLLQPQHLVRRALDEDMAKGNPPGYLVQYADGYESYSPMKAFEDGYTEKRPVLDG